MSNKLLISGCGITFFGERKTWSHIARAIGVKIIDVSGPAISNQTIINEIVEGIIKHTPTHVICQLTSIGKLDIGIENDLQIQELVIPDTIRNFTWNGIWPSSVSDEHISKQHYYKWLYSERYEIRTLANQLMMLENFCISRGILLKVVQGYNINWNLAPAFNLTSLNKSFIIYENYKSGEYYKYHSFSNKNTVPNILYQCVLTGIMLDMIGFEYNKIKLSNIFKKYDDVKDNMQ
jgi:hypothetical protein